MEMVPSIDIYSSRPSDLSGLQGEEGGKRAYSTNRFHKYHRVSKIEVVGWNKKKETILENGPT